MFLIMSAILIFSGQSDWVLVDTSFLNYLITSNDWIMSKRCDVFESGPQFEFITCLQNSIQYANLRKDYSRMDKTFMYKSYQTEVIIDIFFDDAENDINKKAVFTLNQTLSLTQKQIMKQRSYINTDLTQNARRTCQSTGTLYFEFVTLVGTSQVQQQEQFSISIGIESNSNLPSIGVRNFFVYVKYCLPTCKTCSSETNCDTCYYGTPTGGTCSCDPYHQFAQTGIGCRQECARDYFIARSDNICVPDRRIKSNVSYFESTTFSAYSPFQFIQDSANVRSSPSLIHTCSTISYIGNLLYNEGMNLQFANSQSLTFIRLRITFKIQGFLTDNKIQILLDDQIQGEIIKAISDYTFDKVKKIQSSSVTCTTSYDLIRIEAILRTYSATPKLILKGSQLTQATSIWGFRNITIDSGNCQENCLICADFSTCQQCNTSYVLFQNGCVITCPVHSANCIDYADMIPNSRYIAKGFYNLNMSTSDINTFFDETIPTGNNFLTEQKFSIFPTKFVLGGVMVWNNAIYKKSWSISKPHYAVTIRFNVTYGDQYGGNFYYTIQGIKSVAHPKPSSVGQNFIGKSLDEMIKYFELFENPFKSSPLNIEFQCTDTAADPRDQFCAISEYFIVVHYCLPFCQDCNDGVSCITWESGHTNENCNTNQFLYFDSISETYSCITCNQPGCLTCKNLEECTFCDSSSQYNTLLYGVCLSINPPSPPSPSVQCHKQCETCTGALKTNCQSCVTDFHRTLSNNECLCQAGFYDDGINIICLPICGDLLIVNGEDCDDGNYNPYDGCNNCKFGCEDTCKECIEGICFDCQQGFYIVDNICVAICGDNLLVKTEECEDSNQSPNDGCYNCKFSCPNHCIDCQFNQCIKCDESNGWYLKDNNFQPICGDGIDGLVVGIEQCDDQNLIGQDGCFQNRFDCPQFCLSCVLGQCLECDYTSGYGQIDIFNNKCLSFCGDGVISIEEYCDDGNEIPNDGCYNCQYSCDLNCIDCQKGICYECQFGYYLNYLDNSCFSICGDGIVASNEQCDQGSILFQSGCQHCQIECQNECLSCVSGQCYACKGLGWELDLVSRECKSNCGDGMIVGSEQCDDGNEIEKDGCFQCQSECQLQCTKCLDLVCLECNVEGWYLYQNQCISSCGDGIIVENEKCDDGNLIPFDGCFDCQFDCQAECTDCQSGVCYACEIQGWSLTNQHCHPVCGDGFIVEGLEECDDGNDKPDDGCDQCYFKCSDGCIECQQQQCLKCQDNLYQLDIQTAKCKQININDDDQAIDLINILLNQQTNFRCGENHLLIDYKCVNQCGNGLLNNQYEACDDGNINGGDGCSSFCSIEDQYQCESKQDSLSLCTYIQAPEFNLNILSDKINSTQYVELTFSQQVKLKEEFQIEEILAFTITPQTKYVLTINSIQNLTINLNNPQYLIQIEFIEPIQDPVLQVDVERNKIHNSFELDLMNSQMKIKLGTPFVLSETTKEQLVQFVQLNDAMMYSMASISSLALLTGNAIMFFNLLDLLQSLSYIRFMVYQFPPHLQEFLNTYTKVSLQPILNYFQIDQLLNKLKGGSNANQVNSKLNQDPRNILNQLYIYNAKSCYFSAIASILSYFIYCLLTSDSLQRIIFNINKKYRRNEKIIKLIHLFQNKIQKKCLIQKIEYFSLGIFKVYQAILHQFMFSVILQFPNYNFDSPFEIFNSLNAIIGLFFIIIATFPLLSITSSIIKNERKWKYFYFESNTKFWAVQFKPFQIFRTQFYILIIVKLIDYPEAQSILLSTQSFLFLIYLIKFKPLKSVFELSKLICRELLFMIITGTFLCYSFEFSQENNIIIGWIHIGMFCTILASNLSIDLVQQIRKIYENYLKKKQKEKIEQELRYHFNHLQGFQVNYKDYYQQQ